MSEEPTAATEPMPPRYDPHAAWERWYGTWVDRGYFGADPASEAEPYCIVLPPPNVTGALHIGHAFQQTYQDVIVRRARMQGFETLWLPGTDHAGIATEVVVGRTLRAEGVEPRDIGREAFVEKVWEWKALYGDRIVEQMKALGNSCDWSRLRFTMDPGLQHAVRVAFVRLYDDGLIYRGERIINWCPTDRTALSDSEVEHRDVDGELVTFRYPLSDGSGHVAVATTRVETMLADVCIAVHPDDERYRDQVGKTVHHPFSGDDLPVVADEAVDPAFGTGALKVTPAHDPTDFEIARRAGLEPRNVLDADGTISDAAPERFKGLDRYEARRQVLEALEELGLVDQVERPYVHSVGHCYRCNAEIEPWLSADQWFVAVEELKGPAKEAAEDGRIVFHPDRWKTSYVQWLDGLRDWNISRNLWWGHRIPVWYCPDGHEFASVEDPETCRYCGRVDIRQDEQVLDTWFSSQLWPFSTLGWPEETDDLDRFYPTTALVTGYEILYLWVARMVMSGMRLAGDIPFRNVVIHGLIRDARGRKMSKSIGNVIDPLDMIATYGADGLRFALMRMASPEQQNLPLSEDAIAAGRDFANKIWNAARLVLQWFPGGAPVLPPRERWTLAERWLLSRHAAAVAEADRAYEEFRPADAAVALHRFLWAELADWAIELEKGRLANGGQERADAAAVLAWVLERSLRLLQPLMPFVAEEVWQRFGIGESVVTAAWPEPSPEDHRDPEADATFARLQDVVNEVRSIRAVLPPGPAGAVTLDESLRGVVEPLLEDVQRLTGSGIAFGHLEGARARLNLPPDLDLGPIAERKRKQLAEVRDKLERKRRKLANEGFLAKADPSIVEKERDEAAELAAAEAQVLAELRHLGVEG
jgi:valyl-tRNA synthetase